MKPRSLIRTPNPSSVWRHLGTVPTTVALLLALALPMAAQVLAQTSAPAHETDQLAREIFEDLIARRTAAGHGEVPAMAEELARRFLAAGFDKEDVLVEPQGETAYLRVRYPGSDSKLAPIAFLAHMDVVDALREDWSIEPFELLEKDGYFYGRGTHDNKAGIAALTVTFLRLKEEGYVPSRDLVLAFSGDEETTMQTTRTMATEDPYLSRAEFALNADAGGGSTNDQGEPVQFVVQSAEKTYATFELAVRNRGGHSSLPRDDNAIYQLARALVRLEQYDFPNSANDTTRAYFKAIADQMDKDIGEAMRAFGANPEDSEAAQVLAQQPTLVGLIPDDLRRHHADRRPCRERSAAAGQSHGQLPNLPRYHRRSGREDLEAGAGRRRHRAHRPRRATGEPSFAAA